MKKHISLGLFFVLIISVLCGCSTNSEQIKGNELIGYWVSEDGISISFTNDNQVNYGDAFGSYSVLDGSKVMITPKNAVSGNLSGNYGFSIENDTLLLTNLDTFENMEFYGEESPIYQKVLEKRKTKKELEEKIKELEENIKNIVNEVNVYFVDNGQFQLIERLYPDTVEYYRNRDNFLMVQNKERVIEQYANKLELSLEISKESANQKACSLYADFEKLIEEVNLLQNEIDELNIK